LSPLLHLQNEASTETNPFPPSALRLPTWHSLASLDFFSRKVRKGAKHATGFCLRQNWFTAAAAFTKRGLNRNEPISAFRPSPSAFRLSPTLLHL
jgi:hypothetical protein